MYPNTSREYTCVSNKKKLRMRPKQNRTGVVGTEQGIAVERLEAGVLLAFSRKEKSEENDKKQL